MRAERVFSSELESCPNQAIHQARSAHHEFLTVEHLLLAIIDTPTVREVLKGCGANLDQLGADLRHHVAANTLRRVPAPGEDYPVQPQLGFQRVLQRAVFHVSPAARTKSGRQRPGGDLQRKAERRCVPAATSGGHAYRRDPIYRNPTHTYSIANSTPSPTLWLMLAATTLLDFSSQ
jgi:hypothetical protein